eukprot:Pompholyxophrys_punicea_v1_NODE_1043_length_1017_cov_3.658004.p1 type:complete len:180 gc:universal NODE_1043_length_1017_cov_3.658004:591-52(-)
MGRNFTSVDQVTREQSASWSEYKSNNTFKALIGITPTGYISFFSELWSGNVSDPQICKSAVQMGSDKNGGAGKTIYDLLEEGDMMMADRGFTIRTKLMKRKCSLIIPAFLRGHTQLSDVEILQMRRIAHLRIHVERAIGRVKRFTYLTAVSSGHLCGTLNLAFRLCCLLANFGPSLLTD